MWLDKVYMVEIKKIEEIEDEVRGVRFDVFWKLCQKFGYFFESKRKLLKYVDQGIGDIDMMRLVF